VVLNNIGVKNYASTSIDNSVSYTVLVNNSPTDISLSPASVIENAASGTLV
jgi:hypothetical protein